VTLHYGQFMKHIRRILVSLAGLTALALPATALAGNASTGGPLSVSVSGSDGGGGTLPFTGMNLVLIVGIGLGLLLLGLVLRRRSAHETR
jgi:hypothetical protein